MNGNNSFTLGALLLLLLTCLLVTCSGHYIQSPVKHRILIDAIPTAESKRDVAVVTKASEGVEDDSFESIPDYFDDILAVRNKSAEELELDTKLLFESNYELYELIVIAALLCVLLLALMKFLIKD